MKLLNDVLLPTVYTLNYRPYCVCGVLCCVVTLSVRVLRDLVARRPCALLYWDLMVRVVDAAC